jgi:hypothetical protein
MARQAQQRVVAWRGEIQALRTVHVNIHDLLDAVKQGRRPRRFPNAWQLAQYTVATRKIYPKEYVKEMGPVNALMRRIL